MRLSEQCRVVVQSNAEPKSKNKRRAKQQRDWNQHNGKTHRHLLPSAILLSLWCARVCTRQSNVSLLRDWVANTLRHTRTSPVLLLLLLLLLVGRQHCNCRCCSCCC